MGILKGLGRQFKPHSNEEHVVAIIASSTLRRAVWLYRAQNLIWAWLGLGTTVSTITFFEDPVAHAKLSPTGQVLSNHLDYVWNGMWAVGGIFLIFGVILFKVKLEVIGHILVTMALLIADAAIWVLHPHTPSAYLYAALALSSVSRMSYLLLTTRHEFGEDLDPS